MINSYELAVTRQADALCGRYELINPAKNENKFWEIRPVNVYSNSYMRRWGRRGTMGQSKAMQLTPHAVVEIVNEKVAKGYRRVN